MRSIYTVCFSLLLMQFLMSCDTADQTDGFKPGFIVLDNEYDLGDIKSTDSFIFEISNEGDTDLIGVRLSTSNPAFKVTPDFIPVLRPRANQSFAQNIQITTLHGTSPTGIGSVGIMPKGVNQSQLQIEAKTVNMYGDTLRIRRHTTLFVRALVAEIELHDDNGLHPLDSFVRSVFPTNVSPWFTRGYDATGPVRVINTGNVDLSVRVYKRRDNNFGLFYEIESNLLLAVGQDTTIERKSSTALRLDGNNTISDVELLPIQPDGYIYMFID